MASSGWGRQGQLTGVACPRCGGPIVYNGNYFCDRWVYRPMPRRRLRRDECDWALSHDEATGASVGARDRRVWAELRRTYPALVDYLELHPEEDH